MKKTSKAQKILFAFYLSPFAGIIFIYFIGCGRG